jgi:hypothetical protein
MLTKNGDHEVAHDPTVLALGNIFNKILMDLSLCLIQASYPGTRVSDGIKLKRLVRILKLTEQAGVKNAASF